MKDNDNMWILENFFITRDENPDQRWIKIRRWFKLKEEKDTKDKKKREDQDEDKRYKGGTEL